MATRIWLPTRTRCPPGIASIATALSKPVMTPAQEAPTIRNRKGCALLRNKPEIATVPANAASTRHCFGFKEPIPIDVQLRDAENAQQERARNQP